MSDKTNEAQEKIDALCQLIDELNKLAESETWEKCPIANPDHYTISGILQFAGWQWDCPFCGEHFET